MEYELVYGVDRDVLADGYWVDGLELSEYQLWPDSKQLLSIHP